MQNRNFSQLLQEQNVQRRFLCVGLDLNFSNTPTSDGQPATAVRLVVEHANRIVAATAPYAAAYKPNIAFWEALGDEGIRGLREVNEGIREIAPKAAIVADGKRGDIGATNIGTVELLKHIGADAVTLNPYLGEESLRPFFNVSGLGTFLLCRTSNPGSGELQGRNVQVTDEEASALLEIDSGYLNRVRPDKGSPFYVIPLFKLLAHRIARNWTSSGARGLVAGATYPADLEAIRKIAGDETPLLIPGVGTQGGDLDNSVAAARGNGNGIFLINVSSGISGKVTFDDRKAEAAATAARSFHDKIQGCF